MQSVLTDEEIMDYALDELRPFDITVEDFVQTSLDDHTDWQLRELWMFYRDVIAQVLERRQHSDVSEPRESSGAPGAQVITEDVLISHMREVLTPFGLTLEEYVATELEDHNEWELRELYTYVEWARKVLSRN
jgi:hypothetical protein